MIADQIFKVEFPVYRVHAACGTVRKEIILCPLALFVEFVRICSLDKDLFGDIVNWDNVGDVFIVASHIF